jgi:hypothetical protein
LCKKHLKSYEMQNTIKEQLKLTEKQQQLISQFLSAQLLTLATEKRVGNRYYNNNEITKEIELAIRSIAETIWE